MDLLPLGGFVSAGLDQALMRQPITLQERRNARRGLIEMCLGALQAMGDSVDLPGYFPDRCPPLHQSRPYPQVFGAPGLDLEKTVGLDVVVAEIVSRAPVADEPDGSFVAEPRHAALANAAREQAAREELERRVIERTSDLSRARDHLEAEIADHRETETRLQAVQQDLVQANRLAILGQVAAGVAHEINQPLATIRAYADNAKVFLSRNRPEPARENLDHITDLTDRIATITEDLKALARKGRAAEEPVALHDVIDGALMLLRSRFTGRLNRLAVAPFPTDLRVLGNRLRLEQVLINLFQNALEAVETHSKGQVDVSVSVDGAMVTVIVADNGPGLSEAVLAQLFQPFNTSKDKGLGLGLVIAKDIVSDYGGSLEVETGASGATFNIHLRKAEE